MLNPLLAGPQDLPVHRMVDEAILSARRIALFRPVPDWDELKVQHGTVTVLPKTR
jgi:hypothetical protein